MLSMGIVLVASVTLLAGCASSVPRYSKPGVPMEGQRRDEAECIKVALGSEGSDTPSPVLRVDRDAANRCMVARGYTVRGRP